MNNPKISVLMAVYNGEFFLEKAIDSILNQTYKNFEFLIIDDASTDGTCDILGSYSDPRIFIHRNEENIGLTKSLNKGLVLTKGEFIARQDSDDVSHLNRFEKQVEFLNARPEVALIGSQARIIDSYGRILLYKDEEKETTRLSIIWELMFDNPFIHSSVMFRKNIVWEKYGGYDEQFRTSQDFALWSIMAKENILINMEETLIDFRIHGKSVSKNYTNENINRTKPVYINNIENITADAVEAARFINIWLSMNKPDQFSLIKSEALMLPKMIDNLYIKFIKKYPEAISDQIISSNIARKYIYCASRLIEYSRVESIKTFKLALAFDPNIFRKSLKKYIFRLIIGNKGVLVMRRLLKKI